MRIIMNSDEDLDITDFTQPGINIESNAPDSHYSALQMFATSLALCTYSVRSWPAMPDRSTWTARISLCIWHGHMLKIPSVSKR